MMLLLAVGLLLRCDLASGFYCPRAAVVQDRAERPEQHGGSRSSRRRSRSSSSLVSGRNGVEPPHYEHHQQEELQRRRQRPSTLQSRHVGGVPPARRVAPSPCALQASSSSSSSSRDQGLQPPQPQSQSPDNYLLRPQVNGGGADPRSTLGIDRRVLQPTLVPRLAGAITKESPLDFAVVEIPQRAAAKFTPADPEEPVPKEARKTVASAIPTVDTVVAAVEEWKERWPTGAPFQGSAEPPADEQGQISWNLSKGFDVVANQMGAPAAASFQHWLLQVATRHDFDTAVEGGGGMDNDFILPPPEAAQQIFILCPDTLDKAGRTAVHQAFRSHMSYFSTAAVMPPPAGSTGDQLDARPVPNDGRVYLEVWYKKRRSRASWPEGRGEYLEFSVYKAGRSTSEVVEALCQCLHIKHTRMSYAGAKDRRAVTAQKMRCWRLPAEDIHEAQAKGRLAKHGIMVSDYRFTDTDLSLGGLKGNHFEVLLRPPPGGWGSGEAAAAAAAMAAEGGRATSPAEAFRRLRDEGFVNFFGEQRFGRDGTNNVDVGLLLLGGEWGGAIDRIMAPHPADNKMVAEAKMSFFRGDDNAYTTSLFPRNAYVERKLLKALREVRSDPLRAILELPREASLMYVQAYQSLLWNYAASRRMGGEFDRRMAVEGDLVMTKGGRPLTSWDTRPEDEKSPPSPRSGSPSSSTAENNTGANGNRGGGGNSGRGRGGRRGGGRGGREEGEARRQKEAPRQEVVRVTAEDARDGVFSVKHVVLPLPGHSVKFPSHSVGEAMIASLKQDGVDDVILQGHPQRAFDLAGAYRHVVVHPRNFGAHPVPVEAEEESEAATTGQDGTAADAVAASSDERRAAQIGAQRGPEGGMPPSTTAAWLRARFRGVVKERFKGNSSGWGVGEKNAAESLTAIRVSFSLPLGAYATSLLQHVTGEGVDGREKAWHAGGARGERKRGDDGRGS
eukprot:g15702.t1